MEKVFSQTHAPGPSNNVPHSSILPYLYPNFDAIYHECLHFKVDSCRREDKVETCFITFTEVHWIYLILFQREQCNA